MFIVVCGNTLVEDMVRLESKMTALRDLYRDVIISKDIILKVGYSLEPFELQTPSVNLLGFSHHRNSYINISFVEPFENFHVIPGWTTVDKWFSSWANNMRSDNYIQLC